MSPTRKTLTLLLVLQGYKSLLRLLTNAQCDPIAITNCQPEHIVAAMCEGALLTSLLHTALGGG